MISLHELCGTAGILNGDTHICSIQAYLAVTEAPLDTSNLTQSNLLLDTASWSGVSLSMPGTFNMAPLSSNNLATSV